MSVSVFGIRHHGPGSARSLASGLELLRPDCVLIEGPSDASAPMALAADPEMQPPVALLAYAEADPKQCVFYPFAAFSPEWQAMRWALAHAAELRFIDLPARDVLAHMADEAARRAAAQDPGEEGEPADSQPTGEAPEAHAPALVRDPLSLLAHSAGYEDTERWWEDMVEYRGDVDAFAAIAEAMSALREQLGDEVDTDHERRREAHMVAETRRAMAEGFQRIAVVCGAWHTPIFEDLSRPRKAPARLRAKGKTTVTWVPWTYDRLASRSGYGAGVAAPGWYEHLFEVFEQPLLRWLGRVAELLREHDNDISTAHIIETARTAEALSALRGRPLPGLEEINDALRAVLGENSDAMLALLRERLIVGQKLGRVASSVPTVPLQRDLQAQQRSLRLKPEAAARTLELDLRKPTDLGRSQLLHRLRLLGLPWGHPGRVSGAKGTFREAWALQWQPEFAVAVVESSGWGTTVATATAARIAERAAKAGALAELTELLEGSLLADLPAAVDVVLVRFEAKAAVSTDLPGLMEGLPALARTARYGSVRQTNNGSLGRVVSELVVRIAVGLPMAAANVDDEAAASLVGHIDDVDRALGALANDELTEQWRRSLARVADRADVHALVSGRACRLLRDADVLTAEESARRMNQALSRGTAPLTAAGWLEGFLTGSGMAVIYDRDLLGLIDSWLSSAPSDAFQTVLPILRRTFSSFAVAERRQIGERVRAGDSGVAASRADDALDAERAVLVIPVLRQLLECPHER